ncbi:MAG: 3-deoxy-8-phosphooctulonate synthase, partial [Planctomycetes bacterium]|nr:3-deoxy-8-phosphooctulonate synthase [Planctomycetota bacterium]
MNIKLGKLTLKPGGELFIIAGPCVLEDDNVPLEIG